MPAERLSKISMGQLCSSLAERLLSRGLPRATVLPANRSPRPAIDSDPVGVPGMVACGGNLSGSRLLTPKIKGFPAGVQVTQGIPEGWNLPVTLSQLSFVRSSYCLKASLFTT